MNKDLLRRTSFDAGLSKGARNAVRTCLRIQPGEKVTLICDNACREIAAGMVSELDVLGVAFHAFLLEELAARPLIDMPPQVLADLETSDVSIFTVSAQRSELKTRMQMTEVVNRRKIRHAHMVNITQQIMQDGMRADFNKVDEISTQVREIAMNARQTRDAGSRPRGKMMGVDHNKGMAWVGGPVALQPVT